MEFKEIQTKFKETTYFIAIVKMPALRSAQSAVSRPVCEWDLPIYAGILLWN